MTNLFLYVRKYNDINNRLQTVVVVENELPLPSVWYDYIYYLLFIFTYYLLNILYRTNTLAIIIPPSHSYLLCLELCL